MNVLAGIVAAGVDLEFAPAFRMSAYMVAPRMCHELAISLLFFFFFTFSFSFLLASASISPRVLTEPSTLLTLSSMTHPSDGLFILSDSIPLRSTASLSLLAGFLSSYLPQYLCHRCSILLYTPHVSTQIPQPSAGQYTAQSNSKLLNLYRQKTYLLRVIS